MYRYTSSLHRREETTKNIPQQTSLRDRIVIIWKSLDISSIPLRIKITTECVIFSYESKKEKVPCDSEYIRSVIDEIEGANGENNENKSCMRMKCF